MPGLSLPVATTNRLDPNGTISEANLQPKRVLLICPPFQSFTVASLAIAQLATLLRSKNVDCRESYLHFDFGRIIGREKYCHITDVASGLKGELLFAEGLYGTPRDESS